MGSDDSTTIDAQAGALGFALTCGAGMCTTIGAAVVFNSKVGLPSRRVGVFARLRVCVLGGAQGCRTLSNVFPISPQPPILL